jgi:hypothetical protein
MAAHNLVLVHISQLHLKVPALRLMSASKRTVRQWQPPEYVLFISNRRRSNRRRAKEEVQDKKLRLEGDLGLALRGKNKKAGSRT